VPGAGHLPAAGLRADAGIDAALRDLGWLLLSPPLLAPGRHPAAVQRFDADDAQAISAWLDALARQPAPLAAFLEQIGPAPLRLGRRAERLLEFFLRHGPTHRLVAANLQLRHAPDEQPGIDHTTRGEIDFLLEDRAGQGWHWELAVKFFLCTAAGPVARPADFVGPDRAETLPGKLDRLFGRQLALTPPPPWDGRDWRPAAYARGWMFYRHDQAVPACTALAPGHLHGWWVEHGRLAELPEGPWLGLPRSRWMAPARCGDAAALCTRAQIGAAIAAAWQAPPPPGVRRWPSAQLVARMAPAGDGGWEEVGRGFVVPDGWADGAR